MEGGQILGTSFGLQEGLVVRSREAWGQEEELHQEEVEANQKPTRVGAKRQSSSSCDTSCAYMEIFRKLKGQKLIILHLVNILCISEILKRSAMTLVPP